MAAEALEASMAFAQQAPIVNSVSENFFITTSLPSLRHSSALGEANAISRQLKRSCRVMTNVLGSPTGVACGLSQHVAQTRT